MSSLLLLNAPPRSGKNYLASYLPSRHEFSLAKEVRNKVISLYAEEGAEFPAAIMFDDSIKDIPHPSLNGRSPREACIHMAEVLTKPVLGDDYFGEYLGTKIRNLLDNSPVGNKGLDIITDIGFLPETARLVEMVHDHYDIIWLLRIHTADCTFDNDSRNWVYLSGTDHPVIELDIYSNKDNVFLELINDIIVNHRLP